MNGIYSEFIYLNCLELASVAALTALVWTLIYVGGVFPIVTICNFKVSHTVVFKIQKLDMRFLYLENKIAPMHPQVGVEVLEKHI